MTASSLTLSSPCSSTNRRRRLAGRRCRRAGGIQRGSPSSTTSPRTENYSEIPRRAAMVCLLLMAFCSTACLSFNMPRQRMQQPFSQTKSRQLCQEKSPTSLFSQATATNESSEENVSSSSNCEILKVVDDDFDESSSSSSPAKNPAFKDAAESPAPPLDFKKFLTMQVGMLAAEWEWKEDAFREIFSSKKRVAVTIRYSSGSGLKPYYLTVAKRVKDQYPDVLIERVEVSGEGVEVGDGEPNSFGTFEVEVDGKIVARTNQRAGTHTGSIFVSMAEMDLAITRARKRKRPTTVYGEDGKFVKSINSDIQDETVKSRLEVLKQKAMELQQESYMGSQAGGD